MKVLFRLVLLVSISLVSFNLSAQDYIVTFNNDTIKCKIIEDNESFIRFKTNDADNSTVQSLNKKNIISYFNGSLKEGTYGKEATARKEVYELPDAPQKQTAFYFTAGGGYVRRLGSDWDGMTNTDKKILDGIRNGYGLEVDAYCFPAFYVNNSLNWGISANFKYMHSSGEAEGIDKTYKDVQNLYYIGPALSLRYDTKHFLFTLTAGLGVTLYDTDYKGILRDYKMSATIFSTNFALGVDYKISRNLSCGVKVSMAGGNEDTFQVNGMTEEKESARTVSGIMVSGVIGFRTF
ncbi:hypothetical protein M2138_000564 [Dysgonomonadaceae bacterium PH5-43]|nr:hypothetical protein [Dysgonomonadaceae bacterium PH5-43]